MKVRVEIPVSVIKNAYDRQENVTKYDDSGSYMGVTTVQRSFVPIYIHSVEKVSSGEQFKKMTKDELIDWIEKHHYYPYAMEIIE